MYRIRNFKSMNVIDIKGNKLGSINDIWLNFNTKKVEGFKVAPSKLLSRKGVNVNTADIVYYSKRMIVSKADKNKKLKFTDIKSLNVFDGCGSMLGVLEDLLFDKNFNIKAIIVSPGIINKITNGKIILLSNKIIIGEKNILYYGKKNVALKSVLHGITGVICDE